MKITRLEDNPIITPKSFKVSVRKTEGNNINGPCLIKVPEWITNPLGKYYLYFGHHGGQYIRLAYSNSIEGPYTLYEPGSLQVKEVSEVLMETDKASELQSKRKLHVASPDIWIDNEKKELRMYFHVNLRGNPPYDDNGQMTYYATSKNGIDFTSYPEQLAPFYLKVLHFNDYFYGIAKNENKNAVIVRSKTGTKQFEKGPQIFKHMRHCALYKKENILYIFLTKAFTKPETILFSTMDLKEDWMNWKQTKPIEVLKPEFKWEGSHLKIERSRYGGTKKAHALRDPHIYVENNEIYLLYSVVGERGIAIAKVQNLIN